MATEYAIWLGHRDKEHPLSFQWYSDFMGRWPELKVIKPRGLEMQRAKATTLDCVTNYYNELNHILTKYDLHDKPERIYNVDEKGLSTSHKAPGVVALVGSKPSAVTSNSRILVTVLGCGNALGYQVPPFFVFPGARMRQELLEGKTPGADGDVTDSGWSNSDIFKGYVMNHLLKYLPERNEKNPVLLLYDGHRSHINLGIIDWAQQEHVVLFVLPAHTSHVLQPLDVGCFGPYERIFNNLSHKFMREHCGESITRYNICSLGCQAYLKALSPDNLQSSFRRSGIYPFNPNAVHPSNFKPAEVLEQEESCDPAPQAEVSQVVAPVEVSSDVAIADRPEDASDVEPVQGIPVSMKEPLAFFADKQKKLTEKKRQTKKRKYLSTIVSGKAVTEEKTVSAIKAHEANRRKPASKVGKPKASKPVKKAKAKKQVKCKKTQKSPQTNISEPTAGPSGLCAKGGAINLESSDSQSDDDEIPDEEKCCVCKKYTPEAVRNSVSIIFPKWVQCDNCPHWTHLIYCTKVRVIRRGDSFFCCHCSLEE